MGYIGVFVTEDYWERHGRDHAEEVRDYVEDKFNSLTTSWLHNKEIDTSYEPRVELWADDNLIVPRIKENGDYLLVREDSQGTLLPIKKQGIRLSNSEDWISDNFPYYETLDSLLILDYSNSYYFPGAGIANPGGALTDGDRACLVDMAAFVTLEEDSYLAETKEFGAAFHEILHTYGTKHFHGGIINCDGKSSVMVSPEHFEGNPREFDADDYCVYYPDQDTFDEHNEVWHSDTVTNCTRHAVAQYVENPVFNDPIPNDELGADGDVSCDGCFITTATANDGETLDSLRRFRDQSMKSQPVGRGLVDLYYRISPPIAETLASHPDSKTASIVRSIVEVCASLSDSQDATESRAKRAILGIWLTILYMVGIVISAFGHAAIRAGEALAAKSPDSTQNRI